MSYELGKCARAVLPFVPDGPPGLPWFEIIEAAPRGARGHSMSFYQALRPLQQRGLLHCQQQPRRDDGTRPFDRYWLTRQGIAARRGCEP